MYLFEAFRGVGGFKIKTRTKGKIMGFFSLFSNFYNILHFFIILVDFYIRKMMNFRLLPSTVINNCTKMSLCEKTVKSRLEMIKILLLGQL